ncbi:glycosyltransferase family 4 protein [Thalassolituus sp. C2-1]|uniref:glycosyltransferase family 4 protein n=1 Tax=Venatorbacter sp. C2-1 TaxID=2597518 RepID=UPI0011973A92|nr:glycosyltransferase family 4 protein [Thalassolituus sp. C2-1]TVV42218.1 glycosyltransferase family 4 protein [Thalassolituus sp. C2-1]
MSSLVFYCNWGVVEKGGRFFISSIHYRYILAAMEGYCSVILISKKGSDTGADLIELPSSVNVLMLPKFGSYLSAIRKFKDIAKVIRSVSVSHYDSHFYIRSPEPFSWLFALFRRNNNTLVYHFMSNPVEAILNNKSDMIILRYTKFFLYLPEFFLNIIAGRINKLSCNGIGLYQNLKFFFGSRCRVLDESTLEEDFMSTDLMLKSAPDLDKDASIRLLYVGYLRAAKGIDYLLEAFSKVLIHYPNCKLVLVGEGDYRSSLNYKVDQLCLSESVVFLGNIPFGERLFDVYRSSDVFVFPSLSEGSPRVVLEAMAFGLPVIATDVGNTKYLLEGERGICVQPANVDELLNAILNLIPDRLLRDKLRYNSFDYVKDKTLANFFRKFKGYADEA